MVSNANNGKPEKVGTIFIIKGKHQTAAGKLFTGDIGAIQKLQYTKTNDTLCEKGKLVMADPIVFDEPMYGQAVLPKSKNDEDKLSNGLARLQEEDPTFKVINNAETKETVIYGIGDQHLDIIVNKLKNKYKTEVTLSDPKVMYRETITKTAVGEGRHKNNLVVMGSLVMCLLNLHQIQMKKKWCSQRKYLVVQFQNNISQLLKMDFVNVVMKVLWLAIKWLMLKRHCWMENTTM